MKRTRKWAFIGQEAQRLAALGMSDSDIARKLEVRQSTVSRWRQSGKITRPKTAPVTARKGEVTAPAQWAAKVREDYALDATDDQLVTAAQQALEIAFNMAETPATRLNASGRYQSIVKQLSLGLSDRKSTAPSAEEAPARPARVLPARTGVDPRGLLQAVAAKS